MPTGIKVNNIKLGYSQSLKGSGQTGYQLFFDGVDTDEPNIYVDGTALQFINTETLNTSVKTVNNTSIIGTGNIVVLGLPQVSDADNGKILMVTDGQWQLVYPSDLYPLQPDDLRIWIDDFSDVSVQEMYDNYINKNGGCKQYHLTQDTLTIDNITYFIWESNDEEYDWYTGRAYILTTTNSYSNLLSQSLDEDLNNDFTSFGGFLNEDSEESYIDENNRIQYILDVEQNNNDLYIYVDNIRLTGFDEGKTISNYINDPETSGCNPYKLTLDTIDIDGESYYIWEITDDNSSGNIHYLLTTTRNYGTLVNTSVESSKYNLAYKPNNCIYAFMSEDNEIYETTSKNVIVKVINS